MNNQVRAVIQSVFHTQNYVLCALEGKNASQKENQVTFNLANWQGQDPPKSKQVVLLEGVEKFEQGWRASKASPELLENKPE